MPSNFFPRERNGHVDTGKPITQGEKCPNCGSKRYIQTVSTEDCPDCKLHCDYWSGGGPSVVYQQMMDRKAAAEERRLHEGEAADPDDPYTW